MISVPNNFYVEKFPIIGYSMSLIRKKKRIMKWRHDPEPDMFSNMA